MAKSGVINKDIYEIVLNPFDMETILHRRQVEVLGTDYYLKLIEPHPLNWQDKRPHIPSNLVWQTLKKKTKGILNISMNDYDLIKLGKKIQIKCFILFMEKQ
jgi:hypothetical protein